MYIVTVLLFSSLSTFLLTASAADYQHNRWAGPNILALVGEMPRAMQYTWFFILTDNMEANKATFFWLLWVLKHCHCNLRKELIHDDDATFFSIFHLAAGITENKREIHWKGRPS